MAFSSWNQLKQQLEEIKDTLFKSGIVDFEEPYTIDGVEKLRITHLSSFSHIDKETFYNLFKRAHCECLLQQQLDEHTSRVRNSNSQPQPEQQQEAEKGGRHKQPQKRTKVKKAKARAPRLPRSESHGERKMVGSTTTLKFPTTVVPWEDYRTGARVHVFIFPPSGFMRKHLRNVTIEDGKLLITMKWPFLLLDTQKLFLHPSYNNYFANSLQTHPKLVSYQKATDDLVGADNQFIESNIVIQLPDGKYDFTDERASGHHFFEEIPMSGDSLFDTKLIWLFDLSKLDSQRGKFSKIESSAMEDNFALG
ncbi:hypothetical protein ACHAWC_000710 [Mediolabrus comicus]|jgi:hypothetical protein